MALDEFGREVQFATHVSNTHPHSPRPSSSHHHHHHPLDPHSSDSYHPNRSASPSRTSRERSESGTGRPHLRHSRERRESGGFESSTALYDRGRDRERDRPLRVEWNESRRDLIRSSPSPPLPAISNLSNLSNPPPPPPPPPRSISPSRTIVGITIGSVERSGIVPRRPYTTTDYHEPPHTSPYDRTRGRARDRSPPHHPTTHHPHLRSSSSHRSRSRSIRSRSPDPTRFSDEPRGGVTTGVTGSSRSHHRSYSPPTTEREPDRSRDRTRRRVRNHSSVPGDRDRIGSGVVAAPTTNPSSRVRSMGMVPTSRRKSLPFLMYTDGPMLCEYLWNRRVLQQSRLIRTDDATNEVGVGDTGAIVVVKEEEKEGKEDIVKKEEEEEEGGTPNPQDDSNGNVIMDPSSSVAMTQDTNGTEDASNSHTDPTAVTTTTTTLTVANSDPPSSEPNQPNPNKPTYKHYVHQYSLHYIRRFFNHHLDDPWFRQRYSPLEHRRLTVIERTRAIQEAWAIQHEVDASCNAWLELQQELRGRSSGTTSGTSGNGTNGGANGDGTGDALFASLSRNRIDAPSFILRSRLGGGTKPPSSSSSSHTKPYHTSLSNKRKFSSVNGDDGTTTTLDVDAVETSVPLLEDGGLGTNVIPESHVLSLVRQNSAVTIVDVPPYVTDAQIVESLREHCETDDAVGGGGGGGGGVGSGGTNGNPVLEVFGTPVAGVVGCVEGMEPDEHRNGTTSTSRIGSMNPSSSSTSASSTSPTTSGNNSSSPTLYYRTVWAIMENEAVRDKLLENLARSNDTMRDPHDHHSHHHSGHHHHHHHHSSSHSNHHFRGGGSGVSPSSSSTPSALQMDVDCSDPFGRCEIDADGRGGQPPPPESPPHSDTETSVSNRNDPGNLLHNNGSHPSSTNTVGGGGGVNNNNNSSSPPKVPQRFASVFVLTKAAAQMQQIGVLSAAVSSCKRIRSDRDAAIRIAMCMDVRRGIPVGARLETVLEKLFPDENSGDGVEKEDGEDDAKKKKKQQQRMEDILDVSIAYLRRVHLFTFYNGCSSSDNVGSVLSGDHPAGTIHLRLKGADEILKKTKEEHADMYDDLPMMNNSNGDKDDSKTKQEDGEDDSLPRQSQGENDESTHASSEAKDMLVMRLDANIARALGSEKDGGSTEQSPYVVNQRADAMADEIETLEEKSKNEWIDKHAVIDSDGRARCSFHFCRKLFKDRNFLKKHLLKKHPEFLRAECAKCHDSYMMKWWDIEAKRPLPRILVDCGDKYGMMPSVVEGAAEPSAMDPEPDLWREDQEMIQRRQEEEENYRHHQQIAAAEMAERNYKSGGDSRRGNGGGGSVPPQQGNDAYGGGDGGGGTKSGTDFVDVDDMKDEKVELSFDNVIPAATKKKKKKKKKKLL